MPRASAAQSRRRSVANPTFARPRRRSPSRKRRSISAPRGQPRRRFIRDVHALGCGIPATRLSGPTGEVEPVRGVFHYWSAGAMVTLPLLNRNQGAVAAAQAQRTAAVAQADAVSLTANAELAAARIRDINARRALEARTPLRPSAWRQNLGVVRARTELGRGTLLDVLNEERRYLDLERAYTDVLREAFDARQTLKEASERPMKGDSRMMLRWAAVIAAAVALLVVGAGTTYLVMRTAARPAVGTSGQPVASSGRAGSSTAPEPSGHPASAGAPADVAVTLTPEAIERAGIRLAPVTAGTGGSTLRLPGVIEANAYKQVVVTPLVGGRVTRYLSNSVSVFDAVRRWQNSSAPNCQKRRCDISPPPRSWMPTSVNCSEPRSWWK